MFWKKKVEPPKQQPEPPKPRAPIPEPVPPVDLPHYDEKLWQRWKAVYMHCRSNPDGPWPPSYEKWLIEQARLERERRLDDAEAVDALKFIKGEAEYKEPRHQSRREAMLLQQQQAGSAYLGGLGGLFGGGMYNKF